MRQFERTITHADLECFIDREFPKFESNGFSPQQDVLRTFCVIPALKRMRHIKNVVNVCKKQTQTNKQAVVPLILFFVASADLLSNLRCAFCCNTL